MKKVRIIAVILVLVMCAALLTGCGSKVPAKDLVQGNLDAVYLGKFSSDYLKLVGSNEEKAKDDYDTGIDNEVEYFAAYFNIDLDMCDDDIRDEIADLYHEIYAKSKYEVGSETGSDDKYLVELTVYPIDIFQKVTDDDADNFNAMWQARIDDGDFNDMSDEEYEEAWANAIIDLVKSRISTIGYLDPQTISVQVTKDDDGVYSIDEGDFQRIDMLMIQYP